MVYETNFLKFEKIVLSNEMNRYNYYYAVMNKKEDHLANIEYDVHLKKWVMINSVDEYYVFSDICLVDILNVILKLQSGEVL